MSALVALAFIHLWDSIISSFMKRMQYILLHPKMNEMQKLNNKYLPNILI